jgi:hypothetical protein
VANSEEFGRIRVGRWWMCYLLYSFGAWVKKLFDTALNNASGYGIAVVTTFSNTDSATDQSTVNVSRRFEMFRVSRQLVGIPRYAIPREITPALTREQ